MLDLNNTQSYQLWELVTGLEQFNDLRYQDITLYLANAISNAKSDKERHALIALLKLASTVWYNNEVVGEVNSQLTKKLEG